MHLVSLFTPTFIFLNPCNMLHPIIKTTCYGIRLGHVPQVLWRAGAASSPPPWPSSSCLTPLGFFLANTSTSWLRFSREWIVGCQLTSPSKAAAPSSARSAWLCPLFQPERSLAAAVHTRTHAEVKAVTSEGTVESQPAPAWRGSAAYNHPDVSNQLGFSSPASPTSSPHRHWPLDWSQNI